VKLYGDVISPFVRMCLVTAHEAGLQDKLVLVNTAVKPAEVNEALQRLSPLGKIPVLETDHHHAIHDSRVIMEYLTHVSGHGELLPHEGVKRFSVLTLLATAQGLADAAVSLRYEQAQRPDGMKWKEFADRLTHRINAALDEIEGRWLPSLSSLSLGTIGLACALDYIDFRHSALNWRAGRPGLTEFAAQNEMRASLKAWPLV
jgi:glutathione S-transferase